MLLRSKKLVEINSPTKPAAASKRSRDDSDTGDEETRVAAPAPQKKKSRNENLSKQYVISFFS